MADKRSTGWTGSSVPAPIRYTFYKLDTKGKILETIFEPTSYGSYEYYQPPFYLSEDGISLLCSDYYGITHYEIPKHKRIDIDSNLVDSSSVLVAAFSDNKLILLGRSNAYGYEPKTFHYEDISGSNSRIISSIDGRFGSGLWLSKNRVALLHFASNPTINLVVYDTLWNPIYTEPYKGTFNSLVLRYSPKSDELFYSENGTIKKMSLATGVVTTIIQAGNSVADFSVSSDGLFIISKDDSKNQIQIVNLVSGAVAKIHDQFSDNFVISPDNKKVVWWGAYSGSYKNPFSVQDIFVP